MNDEKKRIADSLESIANSLNILAEDTKANKELRIKQIEITDGLIEKVSEMQKDPFGLNEGN